MIDKEVSVGESFIIAVDRETVYQGYIQGVYDEEVEVRFATAIIRYPRNTIRETFFFYESHLTSTDSGVVVLDLSPAADFFGELMTAQDRRQFQFDDLSQEEQPPTIEAYGKLHS